jgi:hypothetical protein
MLCLPASSRDPEQKFNIVVGQTEPRANPSRPRSNSESRSYPDYVHAHKHLVILPECLGEPPPPFVLSVSALAT